MRWALLACWAVLVGSACVLGVGDSSLARLEADVSAGRVDVVRVSGGLAASGRGFAVVDVQWRSGLFAYSTRVVEARPRHAARPGEAAEGVTGVVRGDLGERLQRLQPALRVERMAYPAGPSTELLGRELRGWVVWSLYAVFLSTLGLLVVGPEPWRATRWAWFWLLTSAAFPLTALAFLVLGGPTPLVPAPRERSRRLTGGWAFILASLVSTAVRSGR